MIIVFLISLIACSMNPETAVTFTCGHFNKVVFAVHGSMYDCLPPQPIILRSGSVIL